MGTHARGPWRLQEIELHEGGTGLEIVSRDGEVICDNQTYYPQALDSKNASIVASAPELLEALEALLKTYEHMALHVWNKQAVETLPEIVGTRAVIAKAKGEQT